LKVETIEEIQKHEYRHSSEGWNPVLVLGTAGHQRSLV
jgi:hypothetical protein